jgi:hypothetical protein
MEHGQHSQYTDSLDDPYFESRQMQDIFIFFKASTPPTRLIQPPIQLVPVLFSGVKTACA